MTTEDAWNRLVAETDGDVEMAQEVANSMVEDKQKAVEKANKLKVKPGATVAEKIANAKEVKAVREQAQAELDAWKAIANEQKRRANLQTEQTGPSEEVDENGHPFKTSSNGSTVFGEITGDTGLPNAPIKLSEGVVDDNGNGYGLAHIEVRHGTQIRNAGFNSVEEFVEYVANNYDKDNIKVGKKRANGSGTFIIQIEDKHSNLLYIELSRDGSYWNVNSGGIFRKGYAEKKKNVGLNTELSTSPTTEEDKSFVQTEDKGSVSADTHSDNQHLSTGKGSEVSANNKENDKKVEKKKGTTNPPTTNELEEKNVQNSAEETAAPTLSEEGDQDGETAYSITPAQYTTKRGKMLDMHLLVFDRPLGKDEHRSARGIAKSLRGWYDAKQGGYMMRSAEDAESLAKAMFDEEVVESTQPVSLKDIKESQQNQSASSLNGQDLTTGSSIDDVAITDAKVIISNEGAKHELNNLVNKYVGIQYCPK